jgi:hypothetical protein
MSEDKSKKPKIDLKARLGKGGGAGGPSAPIPAPSVGSVPPPPPSLGAPIPIPVPTPSQPGAPQMPGLGMPFAAPSRPVAAPPPPPPSAAQQTIKVEVAEEVHEERRKASKKTGLYAALALVAGLAAGFGIGGLAKDSDYDNRAIAGAGLLEKEIKAANEKVVELKEKLQAGEDKLRNKEYPEELVSALAALNVPFGAENLQQKQIGNLSSAQQQALFAYVMAVEDVNKSKDKLRNLLGAPDVKKAVTKSWAEEKDPLFNYAVILSSGNKGMVATLVPTKDPFAEGKDWPASLSVMVLQKSQQGVKQAEKKATRWEKGDPSRLISGTDPVVVPVDPESTAAFTSQEIIRKLALGIRDLRVTLEGDASNPQDEKLGLQKVGEDLVNELHKVAQKR